MRIFISSTSNDLADHRLRTREAVLALGHHPVAMEHWPAQGVPPLDLSLARVDSCDEYVGIFAWRYGYVPPGQRASITELEYRRARDRGMPVRAFLLDESEAWPDKYRDKGEAGKRIAALRKELKESCVVAFFTAPENLQLKVTQALADPRPAGPRIVGVNFADVNGFRDREDQLAALRRTLQDPGAKLVCLVGRAGIGKTWLLAKVADEIAEGADAPIGVDGMVYVTCDAQHPPTLADLFHRVGQMLGSPHDEDLRRCWGDLSLPTAEKSRRLLERLRGRCYLLLFDQLEHLFTREGNEIADADLRTFIHVCLETKHSLRVVATSRKPLRVGGAVESAVARGRRDLRLQDGLPAAEAIALLREQVATGPCRNPSMVCASDDQLRRVVERFSGFPRSLHTFVAYMDRHPTISVADVLGDDTTIQGLVQEPARELYESLAPAEQQVVQALAGLRVPVESGALRRVLPWAGEHLADLLDGLVCSDVILYAGESFALPATDRAYAYQQMPAKVSWRQRVPFAGPPALTRRHFHVAAADYYAELARPPEEADSRDDLGPHVELFTHLVRAGQYDRAYQALERFGPSCLELWGHCDEFVRFHEMLRGRLRSHVCRVGNLGNLGLGYWETGRTEEAVVACRQALALAEARRLWRLVPAILANLGIALLTLAEFGQALECYKHGLRIDRKLGDRTAESVHLGDLSVLYRLLGRMQAAQRSSEVGLRLSRMTGDCRVESQHLASLGRLRQLGGDLAGAESFYREGLGVAQRVRSAAGLLDNRSGLARNALLCGDSVGALSESQQAVLEGHPRGRHEACFLLGLAYAGSSTLATGRRALEECVARCDALLSRADRDFEALYYRAAALLALGRWEEAQQAYAGAVGVCSADGVRLEADETLQLIGKVLPGAKGLAEAGSTLKAGQRPSGAPEGAA